MAANLMIVESPNKVAKLKEILGPDWLVAASVGHIRDLPTQTTNGSIGVEAPEFKPKYVFSDRGKEVVARLARLAESVGTVYLATDPDREGEAIAWHLKEALKLKRYRRVEFNAINQAKVDDALKNYRQIDDNLVRAQEARRVLDRFVGFMVSPALSRSTGERLSAGRVQSPATRLVVERERAIQIFVPTSHFGAEVSFGSWKAEWVTKGFTADDTEYVMDRSIAELAANATVLTVEDSESKPASKAPPSPFRTTTLIQAASIQLGFAPEYAMELAQQLFAGGHINYHRTDSQNLDASSIAELRAYAQAKGLALPARPRKWDSVKGAQEGHEAIRPLHVEVEQAGQTDDEKALYRLIWTRAVASQLADAMFTATTTKLSAVVGDRKFDYLAKGRELVSPGWKQLTETDAAVEDGESDDEDATEGKVPVLTPGATVNALSGQVLDKKTQAPSRYTLPTLISKMEKMGIGRPSSYASIMENIVERGYIKEGAGRKLFATAAGMTLVVALIRGKFGFINLDFTSKLELELDKIAAGQAAYKAVVGDLHRQLEVELKAMNDNTAAAYPCPLCGSGLMRLPSGKKKGAYFWGCSMYREKGCKGAADDVNGKPAIAATSKGGAAVKK